MDVLVVIQGFFNLALGAIIMLGILFLIFWLRGYIDLGLIAESAFISAFVLFLLELKEIQVENNSIIFAEWNFLEWDTGRVIETFVPMAILIVYGLYWRLR